MAKTETFKIKLQKGGTREVTGLVINKIWGIDKRQSFTEVTNKNGEVRTLSSQDFYMTHIPTGVLVTNASTQKALKELANQPEMINPKGFQEIINCVYKFWDARGWK